jgi:hypothetical protein
MQKAPYRSELDGENRYTSLSLRLKRLATLVK